MGSIRGSSFYTIVNGPTWTQAEANSVALGGHLVAINSSEENAFILSEYSDPSRYLVHAHGDAPGVFSHWIGLTDREAEGEWRWSTGEFLTYKSPLWGIQEGTYRTDENFARVTWNVPTSWTRDIDTKGFWQDVPDSPWGQTPTGIAEIPLSYFSVSDLTVTEGSSGTVTITRTGGTRSTQTLTLTSSNGTASAGSDYNAINTSISFAAGETSKTVSISTINDSTAESTESLNLTLTASSSDTVPAQISDGTAVVTITDNDVASTPSTFSIESTDVWEGDTASVLVTRTGGSSNAITLNVVTTNGTAKSGSDYTSVNSTLTFAAGETSKTISISTKEDSAKESDETFTVSISSSDSLAQFSTSSATVTIEDNDTGTGNTTTANTNGNNNNVVTGNGNTVSNTTVINNVTNTVNNTTNNNTVNNTTTTNNITNNTTNNVTNTTNNIIGTISVDLSSLIQGSSTKTDSISGSAKEDVLGAGKGADKITGGDAADQFVFKTPDSFGKKGADTITDFNPSQGDKLILSSSALPGLSNPELTTVTSKKALAAAQKSAASLIYYQPLGQLFYDQNGSGKGFGSGGLFAILSGAPALTADDLGLLG